jgi:putative transposase
VYLFNNEIGIKRSIAVDKYGNILGIDITSANEHDNKIGVRVINEVLNSKKTEIDIVIADKGFRGTCVNYVNDVLGKIIHIGNRIAMTLLKRL